MITLADRAIAATLNRRYMVDRDAPGKFSLPELRSRIKKAHRILLDGEFVRAATELSLKPPSVTLEKFLMIQSLGQNVWMEWNERTWAETVLTHPVHVNHVKDADLLGDMATLIDHFEGNNGPSLRINLIRFIDNYVVFHSCGFWLSLAPEEGFTLPKGAPVEDLTTTLDVTLAEGETCYALGPCPYEDSIERDAYGSLKSRIGYAAAGVPFNPFVVDAAIKNVIDTNVRPHYLRSATLSREIAKDIVRAVKPEIHVKSAQSVSGDLRFVIAALILATAEETISDEPWISTGARATSRSTRLRLPGNVFRTLRLSAPKERVLDKILNYVPPATPAGIHKRRHYVRPHVVRSRKKGSPICSHEFDQVPLPHFCVMCGYREWPRKEHYRGDEKLGTVYGPTRIEGRREGSNR